MDLFKDEKPSRLGGGPLGLGDPDDRSLRKTEKQIIIPKMLREEADKKCAVEVLKSLECAKNAGLLIGFKCQKENKERDDCVKKWLENPKFVSEITEKYISARSIYRRTGQSLTKFKRGPKDLPQISPEGNDENEKE